ncbi:FAS1 domain-containing protein [Hypoxylon sp. FL1284]|nr:FAS1 domain-containing protein [Hypoxylon sp. FL1284]
MRYSTTLLPLVAAATAVVIPDEATAKQLVFEAEKQTKETVSSWWESLPDGHDILSPAEDVLQDTLDTVEKQTDWLGDLLSKAETDDVESDMSDFLSPSDLTSGGHRHGPPHSTNLTIYQSIKASNYTKKFAALVDGFPDLVDKLNSTSAGNVTAFVPSDRAFDKIPGGHHHKPPKELVEKIIEYHVLPGLYPAGRVLARSTLPTALKADRLGGRPQRLRVSVGLFGVKLNFYSKVIFPNLFTKNGVLHGVDSILVPPPTIERLISLLPGRFSTLELAAEKTGFKHHCGSHGGSHAAGQLTGLTVFAPTNLAFKKLGPAANAFLFNTEKGLGYLRALLAYHVVANETLYSDEYYGKKKSDDESFFDDETYPDSEAAEMDEDDDDDDVVEVAGVRRFHLDMPTLLGDKHVAVDVSRWLGFVRIRLNAHVDVAVQDGLARDGVAQALNSVLIPPHPHHKTFWDLDVDGEIPVDELVARLEPLAPVEKEQKDEVEAGEL